MQVDGIDHVHIEVRDREIAAEWYRRVLGLQHHDALAVWAEDPMGPLILATSSGVPTLSLFARDCRPASRDSTIAFRVSGQAMLEFLDRLPDLDLRQVSGRALQSEHLVDHELSWSIYFTDPDGNRLELTSYDYDIVANALDRPG